MNASADLHRDPPAADATHPDTDRIVPLTRSAARDFVDRKPWARRITLAKLPCLTGKIVAWLATPARIHTDDVSRAIIEQLQADGRRSYAAIGQAVGLSEAAVRQRVQKLIDSGVMQIVAVTDPMQIGFARQAMVGIAVSGDVETVADEAGRRSPRSTTSWSRRARGHPRRDRGARTTTTCCSVVNRDIRSLDGVERTESWLYLKLAKQTYNWGAQ